jgi:hypothetical protein
MLFTSTKVTTSPLISPISAPVPTASSTAAGRPTLDAVAASMIPAKAAAAPMPKSTWPVIIRKVAGSATIPVIATSLSRLTRLSTDTKYGLTEANRKQAMIPATARTDRVSTILRTETRGAISEVIEQDIRLGRRNPRSSRL